MKANKILITGASGLLGYRLSRFFSENGYSVFALRNTHSVGISNVTEIQIDLLNFSQVQNLLQEIKPDIIIHCAGLTNVDECEKNEELAKKIHVDLSSVISEVSTKLHSKLVHISTDHLWDGSIPMVTEDTPVLPLNAYGRTKADAELAVIAGNKETLVLRTNFFGPGLSWRKSFSDWIINSLNQGEKMNGFSDVFFTPISIFHLSKTILDLINLNAIGIYNTVGSERISKFDFAVSIAKLLNKPIELIKPVSLNEIKLYAPRPFDMSLSTQKIQKLLGSPMPDIKSGISTLLN